MGSEAIEVADTVSPHKCDLLETQGFADSHEDVWTVSEKVSRFNPQASTADRREGRVQPLTHLSDDDRCSYDAYRYAIFDQYGALVFETVFGAQTNVAGFGNSNQVQALEPSIEDVEAAAVIVPGTLEKLRNS